MSTPSKRPTAVRTRSGDVRAALVDAAEAVLVREGPDGVTVRAVAAEAGVAPMGVYNRFGSKEGLIEALLIRGFEGLRAAVAPHGELDPMERLRGAGARYRLFALANQELYTVMFGGALAIDEPSPELTECSSGSFAELVGHVTTAIAAGRMTPGDPSDVAQQIWAVVHGAVTLEMQGKLFTAAPETTYNSLLDLILRGLAAA